MIWFFMVGGIHLILVPVLAWFWVRSHQKIKREDFYNGWTMTTWEFGKEARFIKVSTFWLDSMAKPNTLQLIHHGKGFTNVVCKSEQEAEDIAADWFLFGRLPE